MRHGRKRVKYVDSEGKRFRVAGATPEDDGLAPCLAAAPSCTNPRIWGRIEPCEREKVEWEP